MLEIRAFLTLSIAHISPKTAEFIEGFPPGLTVFVNEVGFIIFAPEENPDWVPADLTGVFKLSRSLGCPYVMLDRDGDTTALLPVFDW
jgi:hypothetical protein